MLHLTASARLDVLADELATTLREPLDDPMTPEWIVVVSAGMQRWLRLCLARRVGTAGPDAGDGVAANLDLLFPGTLRSRLLTPGPADDADPWHLDRLPWAVLDVLAGVGDDDRLEAFATLPPGATQWGRARRLADLFDRYNVHRPEMLRRWARGDDVDGAGASLTDGARWQPHLWRLVRERIGSPSPAELLPERIAALRDGGCPAEVPERVALFGLTTIPGGQPFLDLLDALATQRDVHLLLFRPSPGMVAQVRAGLAPDDPAPRLRSDDTSTNTLPHPLLRSWARPSREAELLLARRSVRDADADRVDRRWPTGGTRPEAPNLLARIQADLRAGTAPAGDLALAADDRSIRLHSCHGTTRQVEVLRDELLHLLADDPTLTEDDIVVLCPAINEYAPFIEAVFGPSASADASAPPEGTSPATVTGPPRLAYRITDRSLRDTSPLFGALAALVDLLGSRFSAPALLDFVSLAPVRARFAFDDGSVTTIAEWVEQADVRWGLDGSHREQWHVPAGYTGGTWQHALDRLLTGVTTSDDPDLPLAAGDVLPLGVEGGNVSLAGRLADLLSRLAALADRAQHPRPAADWSALLTHAALDLFDVDPRMRWQQHRLTEVLTAIADRATAGDVPVDIPLTLADVRRLLAQALPSTGGRPDFFRGGVTISSLTPLRGIPHRVVCLLGMDEGAFGARGLDGDDLTAAAPDLGDRDHRADVRQALLESVLAAQETLVVLRTGHSVVTNRPVPPSVPVAELLDTIEATVDPSLRPDVRRRLELVHPRQAFDERNFRVAPDGADDSFTKAGPWSFDPVARLGAAARTAERRDAEPVLRRPLAVETPDVLDLADLRRFLAHPVSSFLRTVLDLSLPDRPDRASGTPIRLAGGGAGTALPTAGGPDLALELGSLDAWALKERLLRHRLAGGDLDSFIRRERGRGCLPPGRLADAALDQAVAAVEPLMTDVAKLGVTGGPPAHHLVDVSLADGTRIVGSVRDDGGDRPGPVAVYPSKTSGKRRLAAWLDLLVLTAWQPGTEWRSALVCTVDRKNHPAATESMTIPLPEPDDRHARALDALDVVVDLYRRGRCEPLPLFPELSPVLHAGGRPASAWRSFSGRGDGDDPWIQLAFGNASADEICALPLQPGDPDGPGGDRARRFATYLWGAVEASLAEPEPEGDDEGAPADERPGGEVDR